MLRLSVRSLGLLLEQQPPATLLLQRGLAAARSSAQAGKQAWGRPAARSMAGWTAAPAARQAPLPGMPRRFQSSPAFSSPLRAQPRRAFHSSRARRSQEGPKSSGAGEAGPKSGPGSSSAAAEPLSLSARLKKLSREYGWTAVGVYFGLSLLDFPFCFLLVRTLGTDRIAAAEEYVVSHARTIVPASVKEYWNKYRSALKQAQRDSGSETAEDGDEGWGVKEAEERNKHEASLATQLALAYAIHKSFIFVRVPLTAAVTPKVVKVLRAWGWKIGKQKPA